MLTINVDDVAAVVPRDLLDEERDRMRSLITQALELIDMEFARRGRNLEYELEGTPWMAVAVKQAVREMVGQAVIVGDNVGRSSVSSTTGPQSDSVSFSQGVAIHWGGVGLTDTILDLLGLLASGMPRGRGGVVIPFGHRFSLRSAEFSEIERYRRG